MKGNKMEPQSISIQDGQAVTPEDMVAFWEQMAAAKRTAAIPEQKAKSPGRKKQLGSLDSSTGRIMYFVGYCEEGHKTLLTRTELDALAKRAHKVQRGLVFRLFKRWSRRFQ